MANITPRDKKDFDKLIAEAKKEAKQAGIKQSDIKDAILKARENKK